MDEILIFCDGASKGNPGPGGWGAIVARGGHIAELGGREMRTTNNRMELTAALRALELAAPQANGPVVVHTDSSYVINGITKWVRGWQTNGWMTKEKKDVLNKDLWEPLARAVETCAHGVAWQHVGGHVGVKGNERVDRIASDFADGKQVKLYRGPRQEYGIDITDLSFDAGLKEAKASSSSRSRTKAYSYVSKVDGVIEVHKTWAECEARVKGRSARYKKAASPEEEARIIDEFDAAGH
jgi:ribonuclease HI